MKNKFFEIMLEFILPVALLIFLTVNTTYYFFFFPYTGIFIDGDGNLTDLDIASIDDGNVKEGDIVLQIDGNSYQKFYNNLDAPPLWRGYRRGENVPVTVLRDGKEQEKIYTLPSDILTLLTSRLLTQWFMPFMFYSAGLMGLWFLRPRGSQRSLFVLFNFLIALWFSASLLSGPHEFGAQYALRAAFWLWLPVAWHFHWVFPRPLKNLPAWILPVFYGLCIFMALAQVFQWVPSGTYMISFLFAILGSLGLLVAHIVVQPDFRRLAWQTRNLFYVLIIPVGAAAAFYFVFHEDGNHFLPLALLGISALPGFYFFILYFQNNLISGQRMQLLYRLFTGITLIGILFGAVYAIVRLFLPGAGRLFDSYFILAVIGLMFINFTPLFVLPALSNPAQPGAEATLLQLRANRVAGVVIFTFLLLLLGTGLGTALLLGLPAPLNFVAPPLVTLVVILVTLQGYAPFQRWFEQRVLNIPIQPEKLLEIYSERILTSLDEATLSSLFLQEVLPTWLVRQFALLQLDGERLQPVISLAVPAGQLPQSLDAPVAWARLALPLTINQKTVGLMLFGRRDPDDFYAANEAAVLQQIANLTALGLANIRQSAALLELYRTDMERRETERTALAAELHDDVLQHMAILSNQFSDLQPTPALLETYQYTANRIREITSGLRTPLLAFGLPSALADLVDSAQDRGLKGVSVFYDLAETDIRLDERLELHLYRLAQQALDNALQHARASEIRLSGSLSAAAVDLVISDNGVGFAAGERLDIAGLLAKKHFGVAGMFERAALIGAEISIQSQPGQGCRVSVHWVDGKIA